MAADEARGMVCEKGGLESVLALLRRVIVDEGVAASKLRKVACGFLFNLTNTSGERPTGRGFGREIGDLGGKLKSRFWNSLLLFVKLFKDVLINMLIVRRFLTTPQTPTLV